MPDTRNLANLGTTKELRKESTNNTLQKSIIPYHMISIIVITTDGYS